MCLLKSVQLQLNNNAFYIPFTGLNMAQSENAIDMIIVLGSHTNGEGSSSDMMKSRVDQAAQIYTSLKEQNIECRVIMTGYQRPEQVMGTCNSWCTFHDEVMKSCNIREALPGGVPCRPSKF